MTLHSTSFPYQTHPKRREAEGLEKGEEKAEFKQLVTSLFATTRALTTPCWQTTNGPMLRLALTIEPRSIA